MTSSTITFIGARRGPREGTCNEGAHYQWLTASTLLGTGAAESCNGRFSGSQPGMGWMAGWLLSMGKLLWPDMIDPTIRDELLHVVGKLSSLGGSHRAAVDSTPRESLHKPFLGL